VLAACVGIVLTVLVYVVIPAISTADPSKLNWGILISTGVYDYSTLLGGPPGEEFGWRVVMRRTRCGPADERPVGISH
jgi:hypothetical protein